MNKTKLIIQRTLNGLNTEFISEGINENELEKIGVLHDERKEIIQLHHFNACISISITSTNKVLSLIGRTNDIAARNGFYAIRLIIDKVTVTSGVYNILSKIATRYVEYIKQGALNSQNYSDLLAEVDANTQLAKAIVSANVTDKVCYRSVEYNNLDNYLNDPILQLVRKTYMFSQTDSVDSSLLKTIGFIDFELLKSNVRHIHIDNPDDQLSGLIVNNKQVGTSLLCQSSLDVYVLNSDKVQYQDRQGKLKEINDNSLLLRRPEPPKPKLPDYGNYPRSQKKESSSGAIVVGVLGLILGAAGGYFLPRFFMKEEKINQTHMISEDPVSSNMFNLKLIAEKSQSFVVESDEKGLSNFLFKYDSNSDSWKVRGREEDANKVKDNDLTEEELKKILGTDSALSKILLEELTLFAPVKLKKEKSTHDNKPKEANTEDNKKQELTENNKKPENKSSSSKPVSNKIDKNSSEVKENTTKKSEQSKGEKINVNNSPDGRLTN